MTHWSIPIRSSTNSPVKSSFPQLSISIQRKTRWARLWASCFLFVSVFLFTFWIWAHSKSWFSPNTTSWFASHHSSSSTDDDTISTQRDASASIVDSARHTQLNTALQTYSTSIRQAIFSKLYSDTTPIPPSSSSSKDTIVKHFQETLSNDVTKHRTQNIRSLIARLLQFDETINTLIDVGSGETTWQTLIKGFKSVRYIGWDIVPEIVARNRIVYNNNHNKNRKSHTEFAVMDAVTTTYRLGNDYDNENDKSSLVLLMRDFLQYNTVEDGLRALMVAEKTHSIANKYLVATWHHHPDSDKSIDSIHNRNIVPGEFYWVDVFLPPFNFSRPLVWTRDGVASDKKCVGVWRLPSLLMGDGNRFEISNRTWEKSASELIYLD